MAANTYYFEVRNHRGDVTDGVYSCQAEWFRLLPHQLGYFEISDRVWLQGPRGGVKIVKDRSLYPTGYITSNPKWMEKFAWIKLKAKPL